MDKRKLYVMGGSIIGIILFLLLCMMFLSSCSNKGSYTKLEKKLLEAAKKSVENGDVVVQEGTSTYVTSDQLITAGYMKSLDKYKNDGCTASVTIMNNGEEYNYIPYISCNNYKTTTLKEIIIEDSLVTSDDGLYYENGEYIFKGKNPNNIVSFDGSLWYIIKIDSNGNLKLVSADSSKQSVAWDTKFNEDTNRTSGENDYKTSNIHDILNETYEGFKSSNKKHLMAFNQCVGKRNEDSIAKVSSVDCAETLEKQYLGLISPSDYALASYDKDCNDILSGSCINFNYLFNVLDETWTANAIANDSYEVILYAPGRIQRADAREGHHYHTVIYISGDEKFVDGYGTKEDPYVIK